MKTWFSVVPDLFADIVLPSHFVKETKGSVWRFAEYRRVWTGYIAGMGFPWRSKRKKSTDEHQAKKARQANKKDEDNAEAERRKAREDRYKDEPVAPATQATPEAIPATQATQATSTSTGPG